MGSNAIDAGGQVANTALGEAKDVAGEAQTQAKDLLNQTLGQVQDQARDGQQRAAEGLRVLSNQLNEMSESGSSGMATDMVRQAADKTKDVADWLQNREPGDLLTEARRFARQRPAAFLFAAAAAGLVAGRFTRGMTDGAKSDPGATQDDGGPKHALAGDHPSASAYMEPPMGAGYGESPQVGLVPPQTHTQQPSHDPAFGNRPGQMTP